MPLIFTQTRKHEGYFLRDERVSGGGVTECATYTCSHCQNVVMIDPLRTRERAYCPKCQHRLCDRCGAIRAATGGQCKTFNQVIEEVQEQAVRSDPHQPIIIARS